MIKYLNGIQAALYDVLSHRGLVEARPQVAHPARGGAVVEQPEEGVVQPLPSGRRPDAEERPEKLHVPHGLRVHHGAVRRGLSVDTICDNRKGCMRTRFSQLARQQLSKCRKATVRKP